MTCPGPSEICPAPFLSLFLNTQENSREEGGQWGPDVFEVVSDLVRLKVAPLHSMLRRSAALAYTREWWAILATGAQAAAIDCILGQDPQVWVPHGAPPLAVDLAWADVAPEPSRLG